MLRKREEAEKKRRELEAVERANHEQTVRQLAHEQASQVHALIMTLDFIPGFIRSYTQFAFF